MEKQVVTYDVLKKHGVGWDEAWAVVEHLDRNSRPCGYLYMDGNMWCILSGQNLQVGTSGFGKTVEDACVDFMWSTRGRREDNKPTSKNEASA